MTWYKRTGLWLSLVLMMVLVVPVWPAVAQEKQPDGPVYVVQPGDSLWDIAARFGVSLDELQTINGISDPGRLAVGDKLVIPGLPGVRGELVTVALPYGESLGSLSRRYQVPAGVLVQLNHLTSPAELYAGSNLIVPQQNTAARPNRRVSLIPGQSLLELAVTNHTSPWTLAISNSLTSTWSVLPGDVLRVPGAPLPEDEADGPGALPGAVQSIALKPSILVQGKTAVIQVAAPLSTTLDGSLLGHPLHFFPEKNGGYVALQGLHALTEPGLYPLVLSGTLPGGDVFAFSQAVAVRSGDYYSDPVLSVSPETIDPAVTKPEDAQWSALATPVTPQKLWNGGFKSPAPEIYADCFPSYFGNRRSFNGSAYIYFHSGLDFCGGVGTEIMAPATGIVVFAGPLTVRGNATMIDHGWGVYSGYMHQSELLVKPGDRVEAGQVIGKVGGTGRVTGPHLHWELWVGGVQVDPMDWLKGEFP